MFIVTQIFQIIKVYEGTERLYVIFDKTLLKFIIYEVHSRKCKEIHIKNHFFYNEVVETS